MSKQYFTDEEVADIEFDANILASEVQRLDPERFGSKADAQSAFDNLLTGLYNLGDKLGVDYD